MASADRLIEVFNEAKARPVGAERDHFLAEACRDEPELKQKVLDLLQAHEGAGDFLKNTVALPPAPLLTEKPGDRIGRYKLLEQIGEGGCGVVYMAEQEEPVRRRVALKVIKLGMDTKQVIARFEAERQALALMDHPNIAKVLDAGATETGRPFFVMELVRGIKITDYCDQNNLATRERLELFIQVCQAVQHAHQKGIIHRDIKPSNILVTQHDETAVPKVIDFGIAKATVGQLTDKTVFTAFAQFMGTPAYMSPEQAQMSGLDIDTRADIYSLGVLLYELLTGHTPFDAKELLAAGLDEMRRKIREDEPARPSTRLSTMQAMHLTTVAKLRHVEPPRLIHLVRGDLDWLVMKCLEKDRARRYETASALAMDLQRHLNDEPVVARPPSNLYRFQKLVRRNKLAVAAIAAVMTALMLGVVMSELQALRAIRAEKAQTKLREEADVEKRKFQTEAIKSQQVAKFLKEMLSGANPLDPTVRDRTLMREILDRANERIKKDLTAQPEARAELQMVMGEAYDYLSEDRIAEQLFRDALATRRQLGVSQSQVANSLVRLANSLRHQGRYPEAESLLREALVIGKKIWPTGHDELCLALRNLAVAFFKQGKLNEAEATAREALAMRRQLHGYESVPVADSLNQLADILEQKNVAEAESLARESLAVLSKADDRESVLGAILRETLSRIVHRRGNVAEAITLQREAVITKGKLMGENHSWTSVARERLVLLLIREHQYEEPETLMRKQLIHARTPDANAPTEVSPRLGRTLYYLANVLKGQEKFTEARSLAEESCRLYELHPKWDYADQRKSFEVLSAVLTDMKELAALEALHRKKLDTLRIQHPADAQLADALTWLTHTLLAVGKFTEAEPLARECLAIRLKQTSVDWITFDVQSMLGGSLLGQKKYAEAEPFLVPAGEGMKQRAGTIPTLILPHVKESLQRVVQLYEATGRSENAAEWSRKLAEFDKAQADKESAANE